MWLGFGADGRRDMRRDMRRDNHRRATSFGSPGAIGQEEEEQREEHRHNAEDRRCRGTVRFLMRPAHIAIMGCTP